MGDINFTRSGRAMTARRPPPRWAILRVVDAVEAQRRAGRARIDVGLLARRVGLSRSMTSACLFAADSRLSAPTSPHRGVGVTKPS